MSIEASGLMSQNSQTSSSRQLPDTAGVSPVNPVNAGLSADQAQQQAELSVENLQAAVEKMNDLMQSSGRSLNFSVDDSTDRVVVKVVDLTTDEVVRQIPTEETLKFAEFLEGMVGLIFDEQA